MADFTKNLDINKIIALILGIIGLILLILGLWKNWKINSISSWPKTNAVVLNAVAQPANSAAGTTYLDPRFIVATTDDKAQYVPQVVYRYKVGDKEYQSDSVIYAGNKSYNALDTKTLIGQMHPGSVINVYYNPKNNKESYIYVGNNNYTNVIIGLILLLVAFYLFYRNLAKEKKLQTTTYKSITDVNSPSLTDLDPAIRNATVRNLGTKNVTVTRTTINQVPANTFYRRDFY